MRGEIPVHCKTYQRTELGLLHVNVIHLKLVAHDQDTEVFRFISRQPQVSTNSNTYESQLAEVY